MAKYIYIDKETVQNTPREPPKDAKKKPYGRSPIRKSLETPPRGTKKTPKK